MTRLLEKMLEKPLESVVLIFTLTICLLLINVGVRQWYKESNEQVMEMIGIIIQAMIAIINIYFGRFLGLREQIRKGNSDEN